MDRAAGGGAQPRPRAALAANRHLRAVSEPSTNGEERPCSDAWFSPVSTLSRQ